MRAKSSLSVIIPTYNYGRFLAEAIESALVHEEKPLEVIVVDDGSTDDTENVVQTFGDRIVYIRQENAGVSVARNRGASAARGEILAFLDADDILEPTFVAKQLEKFDQDPELGFVHCGMREFDSETNRTLKLHLEGGSTNIENNLLLWEGPSFVHGITVRKEIFERVGGFDVNIKVAEDWDFCYRVARIGKVGFVPEALYNYRMHSDGAHFDVEKLKYGMTIFYEKAFDTNDRDVLKYRRRALGNFHKVIAGSYLQSGQYGKFLPHLIKSVIYRPSQVLTYSQRIFGRTDRNQ